MARILLVEDDTSVRSSLSRVLAIRGHEVDDAQDGKRALLLLRREEYDLVVTDINMPEASGIEVVTHVVEQLEGTPVVAMSGGGWIDKDSLLTDAAALGAIATIEKPIEIEEFVALVEQVLSGGT